MFPCVRGDGTEANKDWVHPKTILMLRLFVNSVLSEQFVPEVRAESGNGGRAQLSVSAVSLQLGPELMAACRGVHACVAAPYLHSRCLLWSPSDRPCSWQWGEVSLWLALRSDTFNSISRL